MDQGPVIGFPLDWLVQLAVSVVLLWGTGGLVVRALAPRTYRRDALLIAPFLGFGILTGITGYLGMLGWPVVWLSGSLYWNTRCPLQRNMMIAPSARVLHDPIPGPGRGERA